MTISTPWGDASRANEHTHGIFTVGAPEAMGIMVNAFAAFKYLSAPARQRAVRQNGYFWFGAESEFLIAIYDAKDLRDKLISEWPCFDGMNADQVDAYLHTNLSADHPDYLVDVGAAPDAKLHAVWKGRRARLRAIEDKDPDLIVRNLGEGKALLPNVIAVVTADQKVHYIRHDVYNSKTRDFVSRLGARLSDMSVVDITQMPELEDRIVPYLNCIARDVLKRAAHTFTKVTRDFNNGANCARTDFICLLSEQNKITTLEAEKIFNEKLADAYPALHPDIKAAPIFDVLNLRRAG